MKHPPDLTHMHTHSVGCKLKTADYTLLNLPFQGEQFVWGLLQTICVTTGFK